MQTGFLRGTEMSGLFIPGIPISACPKHKTSSTATNTAIQSVPRPLSIPSPNQQVTPQTITPQSYPTRSSDTSKSPFSTISSSNYPVPKVGKISSVPRPTTPMLTIPSISPCLPRHIESTLITGDHGKTKPSSLPSPIMEDHNRTKPSSLPTANFTRVSKHKCKHGS